MPPKSKRLIKSTSNVLQKDRNVKNPFLHLFDENPDQFLPSGSICLGQFMPDEKELDEINLKINDVYGAVVVPKLMGIAKEFLESREQFKEKRGKDIKFRTTPVRGNASSKIRNFIDELNLRTRSPIEKCTESEDRDVEMADVTLAASENRRSCKAESPTPTHSLGNETIAFDNRDTGPLATSTPFIIQDDETDDVDASKKEVPQWAQIKNLQKIMEKQMHKNVESIFGTIKPLILSDVFKDYIKKESGN
uniref:INCENP_ARK-bind domain-containing protein n=1 Tax=Rhabditophanes sp. KR3021 TaxID=114890 RepID=A0AC35TMD2_9BILA